MKKVTAKKHLGQHFLINKNIAQDIVNLIKKKNNFVLEIGPGMGVLTNLILNQNIESFHAIEIDTDSVNYLRKKYPKLLVTEGDFLKMKINDLTNKKISVIGNFPYNISSQILFRVFENKNKIDEMIGMFQKEVAERVIAKKGKKRGILSVFIQAFFETKLEFILDENNFSPPPKVKSAVITLKRNKRKNIGCNEELFKKIVKSSYNQRRKTLKNALKSFTLDYNKNIDNLLLKRAEELEVDDFITITKNVQAK
tara:strand:+ start:30409 stop:31170 length:762 start_codon:yes stop_codon:yes gene_type:complete